MKDSYSKSEPSIGTLGEILRDQGLGAYQDNDYIQNSLDLLLNGKNVVVIPSWGNQAPNSWENHVLWGLERGRSRYALLREWFGEDFIYYKCGGYAILERDLLEKILEKKTEIAKSYHSEGRCVMDTEIVFEKEIIFEKEKKSVTEIWVRCHGNLLVNEL